MRKQLIQRLQSTRGETLTETLTALLVIVLSSGMLVSMVLASSHVNGKAIEQDKKLYEQMNAAEQYSGSESSGTVTVTDSSGKVAVYDVNYYGEDDGLVSYRLRGGGG